MRTCFYTFGQGHSHALGDKFFDKDSVLKITAEDPRSVMISLFKLKWCGEYPEDDPPTWRLYHRGVYEWVEGTTFKHIGDKG